ncbi:MAG: DUF3800 domain-containing protein [Chloroflexi bacterium]|nr:DUF3800 domain-containing protein [Chloroflexota bacterium]
MTRLLVFGDESGDLNFSEVSGSSKYFILTTVTLINDEAISHALLRLRRELAWDHFPVDRAFHAQKDRNTVRFQVLGTLAKHKFRVDATLLNKRRTYQRLREDNLRFYKTAWFQHLKFVAPRIASPMDELFVIAATITTGMRREAVQFAIDDVVAQVARGPKFRTACWAASEDPGLQVADYCSWAIQRKWENGKDDAYSFIADKIKTEFNIFGE